MSPDTYWSKRRSCMTEADCAMPLRWAPDPGAERIGPGPWAGAHAARSCMLLWRILVHLGASRARSKETIVAGA